MTPLYDPMVAKLITWDVDREHATRRMLRALGEYEIEGLTTLIPFHETILATEQWAKGETCRDLLEDPEWIKSLAPDEAPAPPATTARPPSSTEREYKVEVGGRLYPVKVIGEALGGNGAAARPPAKRPPKRERKAGGGSGRVRQRRRRAAAGQHLQGRGRRGRRGRGGRPALSSSRR